MYKSRFCVVPSAIRAGLLIVCLIVLLAMNARALSPQEPAPQTDAKLQARDLLNQGVQAFKNGQYDEATQDFLHAKQLDPKLLNARLYLATAYASQYIPRAASEENVQRGRQAVEEFRGVFTIDPQNLSAIDGMGSMLFQMASEPFDPDLFLESKTYHEKHIHLRPQDPEPYYWIGVIDWTLAFRANGQLRARFNLSVRGKQLSDVAPLPPELRDEYVREYGDTIEEGIEALKQAIALRPNYDDAMAYLNLLYRRKADTVAGTAEREELLKTADDLIDKVKEIKTKRMEQPSEP